MNQTVILYVADHYTTRCPSNIAGRRVGYGLTAQQAIAACEPYTNHAPYFRERARSVILTDGQGYGEEVWGVLGIPTGHEDGAHAKAVEAANRKEWSAAVAHAVDAGLLAALPHRPRRDPSAARVIRSYRVHPTTAATIARAAEATGESQGQVVDRLAKILSG